MAQSLARIRSMDRRRRTAGLLIVLALLLGALALATTAVANHVTTAGTPELFNLEHVFNFNPGDHEDRGGAGSTVGSDLEMFTHSVPLRDYATGQLVDEAGDPVTEPVYAERDFAVMGSYDRGGYIFDITDPENPEFVNVAPCRQPRNDVGIKKFSDPVTGQERVVLALSQQTGTPCPNLDVAGGGDPAGVQINSGPNAGDLYAAVQWSDTAPLANQTADFRYAGTGCSDAQYAANSGGDPLAFQGKIAIVTMRVDRGTGVQDCPTFTFFQKVRAAENAGAIGFVQVDEDDIPRTGVTAVAGGIPGVEINNSDGLPIVDQLLAGTTVNATLTPGTAIVPIFGNAAGSGGIGVFDITDPYSPGAMYRVMTTADGVHNFIFHPTAPFGYVSPGELPGGVQDMPIIDFTNLDAPTVKEGLDTPQTLGGIHDMELSITGDRIYAASENNYHILDSTDPGNPVVLTNVASTPLNPPTVPTSGSYAHGLFPDSAKEIMVGQVESIVAGGFLAPGTCPGEGLAAYDISGTHVPGASELAPVGPIGVYNPPVVGDPAPRFCTSHFGRFAPDSRIFSLGWYIAGVRIVDFSDPFQPEEIATAVMADEQGTSNTWAAKLYKGPYVYAGDMERGFDVFKWTGDGPAPWEQESNERPGAVDDAAVVDAGDSVIIDVKANDSDPDHDAADLTVTIETPPAHGSADVTLDGKVEYTHSGDAATSDSFVYRLTDPEGASDTATVTVTINQDGGGSTDGEGRVHGSGFWDRGTGDKHDKVDFSFDATHHKDGLRGKLKVNDKDLDVKLDARTITSLTSGDGQVCDGVVLDGAQSFAFTASGIVQVSGVQAGATFFACGIDNGKNNEAPFDYFYVETTSGPSYNTGDRVEHNAIDGGNIHLHDPIVDATDSGGASASEGAAAESSTASSEPDTVTLDQMFLDQFPAGTPVVLTATAETASGLLTNGGVTLRWEAAAGATGEVTSLTNDVGVAIFVVTVPAGDVDYTAWVGDLDSNGVRISGT